LNIDDLRPLSDAFGKELRASLDDLAKQAEVHGGGLRHGEVEWQVSYGHDGLRRLLMFGLNESAGTLVTLTARAAATDDAGHWASAVAGSTSLPVPLMLDQLKVLVRQFVEQTRFVANSLGERDMRPLILAEFNAPSG
jgi:hypothetical protein